MDYKHIIDVDNLGLLLSFYDDLEGFNQGLERICQKHRNKDVGKLLEAIVSEKKVFMIPRDVKEFYEEYQDFFRRLKIYVKRLHIISEEVILFILFCLLITIFLVMDI